MADARPRNDAAAFARRTWACQGVASAPSASCPSMRLPWPGVECRMAVASSRRWDLPTSEHR